jgi:hypothetical protein
VSVSEQADNTAVAPIVYALLSEAACSADDVKMVRHLSTLSILFVCLAMCLTGAESSK